MTLEINRWRTCSSCKGDIGFDENYWVCSVSTCNRKRTGMVFCSMPCWESHLPFARHRDAWAEEERSPTRDQWERQATPAVSDPAAGGDTTGRRRIVASRPRSEAAPAGDVLVVASRLKKFVKDRTGMNTATSVMDLLSHHLRALCEEAARNAARDGRKTLMGRDFDID